MIGIIIIDIMDVEMIIISLTGVALLILRTGVALLILCTGVALLILCTGVAVQRLYQTHNFNK